MLSVPLGMGVRRPVSYGSQGATFQAARTGMGERYGREAACDYA